VVIWRGSHAGLAFINFDLLVKFNGLVRPTGFIHSHAGLGSAEFSKRPTAEFSIGRGLLCAGFFTF
jgi:UDP-N-acetylglucosamine transferase subunit ALG13